MSMTLAAAIERAMTESKNGYVQHVNRLDNGMYTVSDWYDCDTTVHSYENGIEL